MMQMVGAGSLHMVHNETMVKVKQQRMTSLWQVVEAISERCSAAVNLQL